MADDSLSSLFSEPENQSSESWCFDHSDCYIKIKHLDAFASAFGFFFIGFDLISHYSSPQDMKPQFFEISDAVLWFFKFTFASNAATIIGGCLVTNRYKLRLPAAFISAFVISGIVHPVVARVIWSDYQSSLSPYRFCNESNVSQSYNCEAEMSLHKRLYILDFAGGGAVHLLGGVAGLLLCLLAKLNKYMDDKAQSNRPPGEQSIVVREEREVVKPEGFWDWMYPVHGGGESTNEAALGVFILWFCWFAFNCGSTESIESHEYTPYPYHAMPSIIAVNMIMAAASGGILAVMIASWAQIRSQSESMNANEIANGVLSALVAITSSCPFVEYWGACLIGAIAVIIYHVGCWLEYKLKIEDTARVVPVHGFCGLWSMLAVALFVVTKKSLCNLHATFEGLCYCSIRLPPLNFGERLAAQLLGATLMIGFTVAICGFMYGLLFLIPIPKVIPSHSTSKYGKCWNSCLFWVFNKVFGHSNIKLEGNLLFTGPGEIPDPTARMMGNLAQRDSENVHLYTSLEKNGREGNGDKREGNGGTANYGTVKETLGTVGTHNESYRRPVSPITGSSRSRGTNGSDELIL
uniref:Ammonium transporter AmtB-like domain-containing protein n=2 Tax=Amphimedon queenslandica TaxID=400682 RepID=A0A1X7TMW8_AMPQE